MLNNDIITKLLGLQGLTINKVEETANSLKLYASTEQQEQICPCCGKKTKYIHDYRTQVIKDIPIRKKNTLIILRKRRYICRDCNHRFYEHYDFLPKYYHTTNRVFLSIIDSLKSKTTFKQTAIEHNVSSNTVIRAFKYVHFTNKPQLPEVLGIDEFKGNACFDKYQVQLTDIEHRKTIDILPTRKKTYLIQYFDRYSYEERKKVKFLVMDMWKDYRQLNIYFPNAKVIVDKYHFVRQVYWALNNVRKRVQKNLPSYERKYFKRSKWLLNKKYEDLDYENSLALNVMLSHSNELNDAWVLKELLIKVNSAKNTKEAQERLRDWLKMAKESNLKEFKNCIKAYQNWFYYITEVFDNNYTNAYTEGKNNYIKVIKRISYGFRNFYNFRNRILLSA